MTRYQSAAAEFIADFTGRTYREMTLRDAVEVERMLENRELHHIEGEFIRAHFFTLSSTLFHSLVRLKFVMVSHPKIKATSAKISPAKYKAAMGEAVLLPNISTPKWRTAKNKASTKNGRDPGSPRRTGSD